MEIADVAFSTGGPVRICDDADEAAAAAVGESPIFATLRRVLAREARDAAALAALVMAGGWQQPPQPVHVAPLGADD